MVQRSGLAWLLARGPRATVWVLVAGLLAWSTAHSGHSVESMDVRTYAQMIRGVAEHGLPYWDNGPTDRFPELLVPWGISAHGHVWGVYGPLYAYLAAPAFRLGSLQLVSVLTFALLAPLALGTFFLAKRIVENEWYAALAAALVVFSTPIMAKAMEITAYPLTAVLAAPATYFAIRAIDPAASPRASSLVSGLFWGALCATHALGFPMALSTFAVLAMAPGPQGKPTPNEAIRRLAPALAGLFLTVLPVAWLNHVRFDSFNPLSYGPIPWTGLVDPGLLKQNVSEQLRYGAPCLAFVVVTGGVMALVRRERGLVMAVLVASLVVALFADPLRTRFIRYGVVAWGFLFDVSLLDLGGLYVRQPDGLGTVFGGFIVKSLLQCTPILAIAPLAARLKGGRSWTAMFLLAPSLAMFASLLLRANLSNVDAIGWPWVYVRYTIPALPMLVVASVAVLEDAGLGAREAWIGLGFSLVMAVALRVASDDALLARRVMLLVLPLAVGAAATCVAAMASARDTRLGRAILAITVGTGIALGVGNDYLANAAVKSGCDGLVDRFSDAMPQRFALVGVLGQFDVLLSTAATRDVEYADLLRIPNYESIRPLLDYWRADRRPIYLLSLSAPLAPWPDVAYAPVKGIDNLYLLQFTPQTTASR
jgi:hypothetical protein